MQRRLYVLAAIALFSSPLPGDDRETLAFTQKHCAACHNASVSSGGVNLAALQNAATFSKDRPVWERVLAKVKTGEMPPPGIPKPPPAQVKAVTSWLEAEFSRQDDAIQPDAGIVAARRLNRDEYNNTIRDLLGVDIRPADSFPQDQAAFGFDNVSDALNISSVLLEKYADAAERSVRVALFGPEKMKPSMAHYPMPVRLNQPRGKPPKLDLTDYDLTGLSTPHAAHVVHRFPVDGTYSFRLVLNGHRPNQSMPVHVALWIDGKQVNQVDVDATDLEGQVRELRAKVTAGEHLISASYLKQFHGLPPSYNGPEPSTRPPTPLISARGKLTEKDIETLRRLGTTIKTDAIETRIDQRFESIDVGGPFDQASGPSPANLRRIFICGHAPGKHNASCARVILADFARRAFRRPLEPHEADKFVALVTLVRKHGDSFEEGIAQALQAVLVSPNFLYRIERGAAGPALAGSASVGPFELASRLSYFLWSSMPDEQLFKAAAEGRLSQPAVLEAQVRRMLRDDKAEALVENFAGQWLQFRNIDVVRPDPGRFPEFDDSLRLSMRKETELFSGNIMRHDGSVLDFLNADYSFLDERLARFYGIPGIEGPQFRRVEMKNARRGGGVLAQGSVLTISSYSTRTSPVLRGKWILETLLNAPPPPPPPSVPALDDSKVGQSASLRQQLEEHRKKPACASCHSKMDPLGFGLENLNAIGAWRDKDGQFPVDSSGKLPDGRTFQGPQELQNLLLGDRNAFVAGLTEKIFIYALGRGLERFDRPALRSVEASVAARNYRFSQLVLGVVNSLPFQRKHVQPEPRLNRASASLSK